MSRIKPVVGSGSGVGGLTHLNHHGGSRLLGYALALAILHCPINPHISFTEVRMTCVNISCPFRKYGGTSLHLSENHEQKMASIVIISCT
jgi:hypothetical protein